MRFDLRVPFAEKDAAKALGARWDAANKLWYVVTPDLAPFAKWNPTRHEVATPAAGAVPGRVAGGAGQSRGVLQVGSRFVRVPIVCACPPWLLCDACRAYALPT